MSQRRGWLVVDGSVTPRQESNGPVSVQFRTALRRHFSSNYSSDYTGAIFRRPRSKSFISEDEDLSQAISSLCVNPRKKQLGRRKPQSLSPKNQEHLSKTIPGICATDPTKRGNDKAASRKIQESVAQHRKAIEFFSTAIKTLISEP